MDSKSAGNGPWWREAVIYQIYPLSFGDSNGDGFGDLEGIIQHLDYLSGVLGVDAVWLSPFFESPMRDWGYDVSNHTAVDPLFGTLDNAKDLIEEIHVRGMRVIVDYVLNHTSDQHDWFKTSRSSRDNPKRDWYVWRDGRDGGPPNNWVSVFSGSSWSLDEATDQWYRHSFLPCQPDLNWRNPEVVEAMMDVARFWLDLGVDGFRLDAAHQMMKDVKERDNPPAPPDYPRPWKDMGEYDEHIHLYDFGQPAVHEAHRTFRDVTDSYDRDALTVGEMHIFDLPEWASYYGDDLDQLNMPFNFHLMASGWNVPEVRATIESVLWNVPVGAWTNWTLGNHDEQRLASRLPEGHERIAALLILTLRGTPFLYYGDELGMVEARLDPQGAKDPWGERVSELSRDGSRTPMQWTSEPNAGFTDPDVDPWLPVHPNSGAVNVEAQLKDNNSILNMYRRLLELRRGSRALRIGSFIAHPSSTAEILVYRRESDDETMTVALNFSDRSQQIRIGAGSVVFSTGNPDRFGTSGAVLQLDPKEGVVVAHR